MGLCPPGGLYISKLIYNSVGTVKSISQGLEEKKLSLLIRLDPDKCVLNRILNLRKFYETIVIITEFHC